MVSYLVRSIVAAAVVMIVAMPAQAAGKKTFVAHLSGDQEVGPVDTPSQGQAIFQLTKDGTGLTYRLITANIEAVTQAHIHLAPAGSNGNVVAFLFGFVPEGASVNGTLAQGVLTDADLIFALAGMTIADLIDEFDAANAYVNVHTQDVPSGEIRGQIQ